MSILKPFALTQLQAHLKTGEICIILSGEEKTRNHDVHYPFRASSHFKYFCTLNETDCALVIEKTHKGLKINLFKKPYDAHSALWTSGRMPLNQAKEDPLIEDVALFEQFPAFLQSLPTGGNIFSDPHALIEIKTLPLNQIMGKCRMLKKDAELSDIQKAINLSAHGHKKLMQTTLPGMNEAQLALTFMHEAAKHGISEQAYPPIIAGGERACILHYCENNQPLQPDTLVLIDAGIEVNGYASDITRTFPVSGKFSPAQKALYEVVLAVQAHAIEHAIIGQTWSKLNQEAKDLMLDKLLEIGFLSGTKINHQKNNTLSKYFYHGLGHWLGLDVHDPCPYKNSDAQEVAFEAGMVITIEPGIYVRPSPDIDEKWHNIGIRIEDDILITETGAKVLSAHIPKTIDEIEALCQK